MATIKYNGVEIQSITECKVFEEPREMLVWNTNYGGPIEKMVCAIIPYRHSGSVITMSEAFEYCAEIPKKTEPRRATNRELAKWIASSNGEVKDIIDVAMTFYSYPNGLENTEVRNGIKVRKWDDTEWHEPTVDYMDIGTNAVEKRMSKDCKVKTRHFWMIHKELQKAIEKHPNFCSTIIDPASSKSWIETERQIKLLNECGPKYAEYILMEEMAEAFAAYEQGDKEHALQELAQCGAVILRIMETIEKEIKK